MNTLKSHSTLNGILIVNRFLSSAQTDETYSWLMAAAQKSGVNMVMMTNADFYVKVDTGTAEVINAVTPSGIPFHDILENSDFILFWNKDVCLARALERMGFRLFNCADAILNCDNKALTFEAISKRLNEFPQIRMPLTYKIPMTFGGVGYTNFNFLDYFEEVFGYPFVIKECCGSYGGQVYLADSRKKAVDILSRMDGTECIAQHYVASSFGRDLRVYVVGDKASACILRKNPGDFRANISNGGSAEPYEINDEQADIAIAAAKALDLDFAGVDLMFDENDKPILCEVNSNAQFRGLYMATGINMAEFIMEYIRSVFMS